LRINDVAVQVFEYSFIHDLNHAAGHFQFRRIECFVQVKVPAVYHDLYDLQVSQGDS